MFLLIIFFPFNIFQALRVDLIKFLLVVLDSPLPGVKNASGAKAQIVKALKSMLKDLTFGEQVYQLTHQFILLTLFYLFLNERL